MVFSSLTFLYLLLPLAVVPYFLIPDRHWRNFLLLAVSLLFYAWGEPKYLALLLAATAVTYAGTLAIAACPQGSRVRRAVLVGMIVLLVADLMYFKYLGFFWENLGRILPLEGTLPSIALPLGISFYTFQLLSYLIDVYRGQVDCQRNFFYLLLYVSFFPQLVVGPIVRYGTVADVLRERETSWDEVAAGLKRFILGLAKKVLIANQTAAVADLIYNGSTDVYGTSMYWLAAFAYTMQIYFDFSGYSDMALGLGRMFGFRFDENFDHPYVSLSATEFWRRWHISLSTWFRDYIYIPLGGNRVDRARWVRNILIVWILTGFWHGAQWNFILWGLYYAAFLLLEKFCLAKLLARLPVVVRWLYAFFVVDLGWVLFNLTDFDQLAHALHTMFVWQSTSFAQVLATDASILHGLFWLPLALVCSFPLLDRLPKRRGAAWTLAADAVYGVLFLVCLAFILSSSYDPFIYFRF